MKCLRWCPRYTEMVPLEVSPESLWGNKPHHWNGGVYPEVQLGETQLTLPLPYVFYHKETSTEQQTNQLTLPLPYVFYLRETSTEQQKNQQLTRGIDICVDLWDGGRTLDIMYIMWIFIKMKIEPVVSGYAMVIWYFAVLFEIFLCCCF